MAQPDLILLHSPRVYDFRKLNILYGPDSDIIFSSSMYEMYPIGFLTISEYLRRHGYIVRVINLAVKMLSDKNFDAEKYIKSLSPIAFGIDLHWLPHAQGSLEIAKICKKYHPRIPVIFGGLSASYYHKELAAYPQVDYVIRGDSAEEPLRRLVSLLKKKNSSKKDELQDIPNLTWKENGQVYVNSLTHVPENLNELDFDYRAMIELSLSFNDLSGYRPFTNWFSYPVTGVFTCRGCLNNCITCGGSNKAFTEICNRNLPAYRDPELVARDILLTTKYIRAPIMVIGDINRRDNDEYGNKLLDLLEEKRIDNYLLFEFFQSPDRKFLKRLTETIPNLALQFSPESHDEGIRREFGRDFSNDALEKTIQDAIELGCKRFDLFFMTGLPKQTKESVFETVEYCKYLLEKFGWTKKLHLFIAPLAPFVDPGSIVFENPVPFGYKLFYKTLEEHRQALLKPTLKYTLNYETQWMDRGKIISTTLEAESKLNQLKVKYELMEPKFAQLREKRIRYTLDILDKIDRTFGAGEENLINLTDEIKRLNRDIVYRKQEMELPKKFMHFNLGQILHAWFTSQSINRKNVPAPFNKEMKFTQHLEELRKRIINAVVFLLLAFVVSFYFCFTYRKEILSFLIKPVGRVYFLTPTEAFMTYVKLSLILGLVLASPIILYQIWSFVSPGLKMRERRFVLLLIPSVSLLFILGAMFAYFVLIPAGIKFLLSAATPDLLPMITIDRYLSFILMLILACGIVFQLPVLSFFLTKIGVISAIMLVNNWKYIIFSIFVIAAIVTPTPDVFNQLILAIPMVLLYGVSIWVSWLAGRKKY